MTGFPRPEQDKRGCIVWFTGLSGAGKTSLSQMVVQAVSLQGYSCLGIDEDAVAPAICDDLGISAEDRQESVRRIAVLAQELAAGGSIVLVAAVAPYREQRERLRAEAAVPFVEIFLDAAWSVCRERKRNGLYRRFRREFAGSDAFYEAPEKPDFACCTATETLEVSRDRVVDYLAPRLGLAASVGTARQTGLGKIRLRVQDAVSRLWSLRGVRVRSELSTRLRFGDKHFQASTYTAADRYPHLFAQCRDQLAAVAAPRILSFGCSTGEEVASLARYMPQAEIVGTDINEWCLEQGRRRKIAMARFLQTASEEYRRLGCFDAIFCMAVFQRTENRLENTDAVARGFTFEIFEEELEKLNAKLRPGGLLFLDHCDFRFEDARVYSLYEAVPSPSTLIARRRPVFGRDNKLFATEHLAIRIFRKRLEA